jgi:hypothetical protein
MSRFPWPGKRVFFYDPARLSRNAVLLALSAWLALLLVTHRGPRSPYSYVQQAPHDWEVTRPAAPDALTVVPVTRFFYDGTRPADWTVAHNLRLPLHSFAVSVVASFVRRYDLANDLANLLFLIVLTIASLRLADRFGLDRRAQLLGLATIFALPSVVGYIGQPMHYIVGPVINALVILIAIAAGEARLRNPLFAGTLTAILCINYDWYVFAAALAVYVLFVIRRADLRTIAAYFAVSIIPAIAWHWWVDMMTGGAASKAVRNAFIASVISGWMEFLTDPGSRPLLPVAATQLAFHVAVHEIIALIHWPLVVCCVAVLWRERGSLPQSRVRWLPILLLVFYAIEQLVTAAFDWENNPRRALPVLVAFACAYLWSMHVTREKRRWRIAFLALFVLASLIAFADVLTGTPGASVLYIGEAIRGEAKIILPWQEGSIAIASQLEPKYAAMWSVLPRAASVSVEWVIANAFNAFWMIVLFALLERVELLPRRSVYVCAAVIAVSAVRFAF